MTKTKELDGITLALGFRLFMFTTSTIVACTAPLHVHGWWLQLALFIFITMACWQAAWCIRNALLMARLVRSI